MSLQQDLEKIGLSDKEARVYLAVLALGQETVQTIAQKADVNRATTYVIIDSLMTKGLVSSFLQGKKTFYAASSPEALHSLFDLQKQEIEARKNYLEAILPELKSIANTSGDKPVIRFYEGLQGIENAHQDFFSEQNELEHTTRTFFPYDRVHEVFSKETLREMKKQRLSHKIFSKVIYNSEVITLQDNEDGQRVKVDSKEFPFSCDVSIYGDSVRIASLGKKLSAVLIKDKDVANTFKSLFDLAWKGLHSQNKE